MPRHDGPTDAFAALGHPIRVDILAAAATAQRETDVPYPIGFAALRRVADVDVSSQFNYHLDRLRGRFLRKGPEGYELTYAGWEVTRAMTSGVFADVDVGPFEAPGGCPLCGSDALVGAFRNDWATVSCEGCGRDLVRYTFSPAAARDRDPASFLDGLDARLRAHAVLVRRGVCPECGGEIRPATQASDPDRLGERRSGYACEFCGNTLFNGIGFSLLCSRVLEEFLRSRGEDPRARRCWEFAVFAAEDPVSVTDTAPWRAVATVTAAGDTLAVHLDDAFEVRYASVR